MAAMLIVVGILATLFVTVVTLFTLGTVAAAVVLVAIVIAIGVALRAGGTAARAMLAVQAVLLIGSLAFLGFSTWRIVGAVTDTEGVVDPPDAASLASAEAKLDAAESEGGFRIELTEAELAAVFQDTLAESENNPIQGVGLTILDPSGDRAGSIRLDVRFKGGGLTGRGRVGASLRDGEIRLEIQEVQLGNFSLPGLARSAMNRLIESLLDDLNQRLLETDAEIQALEIGGGRVLIVGTQTGEQ